MENADDSHPDIVANLERQKLILLGVILLLSGIFGILDGILAATPGWEKTSTILDTLSFMFCLLLWCATDAQLRGYTLSRSLRWTIFLVAFVGFPIYAFRSRGRRGWLLLAQSVLFLLLMVAVSVGAELLADVVRGAAS
ncbi:MAG: hypothetical protein IT364_10230 [Candidatus Hydrogenedentes bacterium]|nr:hypothetical protein [Candidatus Hydrogenedentota bacterium]